MANQNENLLIAEFEQAWEQKRFLHNVRYTFIGMLITFIGGIYTLMATLGKNTLDTGYNSDLEFLLISAAIFLGSIMVIYVYLRNKKYYQLILFYNNIQLNIREHLYGSEYDKYTLNLLESSSPQIQKDSFKVSNFTNKLLIGLFFSTVVFHCILIYITTYSSILPISFLVSISTLVISVAIFLNYHKAFVDNPDIEQGKIQKDKRLIIE